MVVVPREAEKLNLNNAGFLAQKHLARGLRLNRPKAAALIATQVFGVRSKWRYICGGIDGHWETAAGKVV
ncbi:hypothetical protein TB1_020710 [Malus domestica]